MLGGSHMDWGNGIEVDISGAVYATGLTISSDFPTTPGAFQPTFGGGSTDGFITKLNASGSRLVYSTFLGGGDFDGSYGVALDASGMVYAAGNTNSANFPVTPGAFQTTWGGGVCRYYLCDDAFVTKLNLALPSPGTLYRLYLPFILSNR